MPQCFIMQNLVLCQMNYFATMLLVTFRGVYEGISTDVTSNKVN